VSLETQLNDLTAEAAQDAGRMHVEYFDLGGQFLCDPNEINGWGAQGPFDNVNSQDLGNSGATALSWIAGGFERPFNIQLRRMVAWHRNNNNAVLPWGWVVAHQTKTADSNAQVTNMVLQEVNNNGGVGPRDYGDNVSQRTDLDLTGLPNSLVPAGNVVVIAVDSPTAVTTNRYVQVMSGWIEYKRVY